MAVLKAVLFDAVGTLIYPSPSVAQAYASAAARQGLSLPSNEVSRRFRAAFAAEELIDVSELQGRTDSQRELDCWQRIVAAVFPDAPKPGDLFAELWAHFASPSHWEVYSDVEAVLGRLSAVVTELGIASNFDERLHAICRGLPILDSCQRIFVSSEIGWRKPALPFFRAIERQLKLRPEEILLVGDSIDNDYLAARQAGWQAVWLDRESSSAADDPRFAPGTRIGSLADLPL